MLNDSVMDEGPKWMRTASEDKLREFVRILDANENHPMHSMLKSEFDKECNRRAVEYYEARNGGEWI
ncbi:MAG: hypothetical protein J6Q22_09780 [Prevotella sp.]|nr:hypothetical protein [Prevotella sp.]